ncbi:MAG: SMC-Scp complex subunit ScpB [Deltaproteobacteria bacterium]|nr:SMC-Scp complex subunit ScpB [Deltaproteobacteria bacterium]
MNEEQGVESIDISPETPQQPGPEAIDAEAQPPGLEPEEPDSKIDQKDIDQDDSEEGPPVEVSPRLKTIIESLLFAAADPVPLATLLTVLRNFNPELSSRELRETIEELRTDLREQGRGIRIAEVAGGYQARTPSEAAPYLKKLVTRRAPRLTRATLECLAIVAYRQPLTRGEVEDIRGVDCGAVLRHLLEKKLVKILGRKDEPGRPLVYGTSKEFLEFFSMKDLTSLPTLRDFAELTEEHRDSLGLDEYEIEAEQKPEEDLHEALTLEDPNAYAPIGEDKVVRELAEALEDVRQRDRLLKKDVFGQKEKKKEPADQTTEAAPEADGPPPAPGLDQPPPAPGLDQPQPTPGLDEPPAADQDSKEPQSGSEDDGSG